MLTPRKKFKQRGVHKFRARFSTVLPVSTTVTARGLLRVLFWASGEAVAVPLLEAVSSSPCQLGQLTDK